MMFVVIRYCGPTVKALKLLVPSNLVSVYNTRLMNKFVPQDKPEKCANQQRELVTNLLNQKMYDWSKLKSEVLDLPITEFNTTNFEGVLFKYLVRPENYEAAISFTKYLLGSSDELNLGAINGILSLYYKLGRQGKLTDSEKSWICQTHKYLKTKYKVLDRITSEKILCALCIIGEWKPSLELLEDINISSTPTHIAYSNVIAALFDCNEKAKAMEYIRISLNNNRQLYNMAYEGWINYVLRKYKTKNSIIKYLDEIFYHIADNFVTLNEEMAVKFKETYENLGWKGQWSTVNKSVGKCSLCKEQLRNLSLTDEEFTVLQRNVKEKMIVGADIFLKTSPIELEKFNKFMKQSAPFDIVLDALNIGFAVGKANKFVKVNFLISVIKFFKAQNKKILFLGRKHMKQWPKAPMSYINSNCYCFFTEDISEDDPFMLTAAVLSGPNTDVVSKDLFRGHRYKLQDEKLRLFFQRWQWQHQWVVTSRRQEPVITPPLTFTPCAQKGDGCWHMLYERYDASKFGQIHDGLPNISTWLCLKPGEKR